MVKIALFLSITLFTSFIYAQNEHKLIRRIVVFPVKTEVAQKKPAEESWWKMREYLTSDKRYLVASKSFLLKKDVFQSRGELSPADAIILGQLLDAHALVTTYLKGRRLYMKVYQAEFGHTYWQDHIDLSKTLPINQQLSETSVQLMKRFIGSIPYQGFVVVDSLIGQPVYKVNDITYFKVQLGINFRIQAGDKVQLIKVVSDNLRPLFIDGAHVEVYAEGNIVEIDKKIATIELKKVTDTSYIKQKSLVRIPREYERLRSSLISQGLLKNLKSDKISADLRPLTYKQQETSPLVTSLTFVANLALFLLFAL